MKEKEKEKDKEKKKSWKKKTAVGMVAAAASASVLVGGAFDSPADLLNTDNNDNNAPAPVVHTLTAQTPDITGIGDTGNSEDGDEQRQRLPAVRRFIQSLPVGVRAVVGVPLWCIGWGITEALSLLWQAALTPVGGKILSWLLAAAVCVLVYALTAKALFPHAPWKKILRPRNLLIVIGGMIVLGVADTLLGEFWSEYPPISRLLRLVGGALMVTATCLSARKLLRRRDKEDKPAPAVIPSLRTDVEQQAMALADSVCPPSVPRP